MERYFRILDGGRSVILEEKSQSQVISCQDVGDMIHQAKSVYGSGAERILFVLDEKGPHFSDYVTQFEHEGFSRNKRRVMVHKDLSDLSDVTTPFMMKRMPESSFREICARTMSQSPYASVSVSEWLEQMKGELGSNYTNSLLGVFENGTAIGITMPHIEPHTFDEGRLFFFGLVPEERGKGKSAVIHLQSLSLLKRNFGASTYIGATDRNNRPMLHVFEKNDCRLLKRVSVYTWENDSLI
ncbi:GNAT family N-acetyltransferase [Desmospora activa]|uniref:N-acetyltransferase domain-containing protein n=1 Tax=Desmospora activa DSM 45169 TaxID=1121389 RepID=A0A2T4Z7Y3_9BACL|nr:GNAT family N-acetyltransferase [Desmospora activa]PTM57994.1 hypothetical protein C8J48_0566 [Desmospora activa DSM 45169]